LTAGGRHVIIENPKEETLMKDMESIYRDLLKSIGEDLDRDGLKATPKRAARAFEFLTRGYTQDIADVVNGAIFESDNDEMIIVKDIELYSLCEHHLLPFFGKCHVGYIPKGKVIGLSKIARIVDVFARRLQIQENLTKQVADTIMKATNARGVGVVVEAQHLCMMMRGVEKQNSIMKTSCMLGVFRSQSSTRSEFLSLIR
jgi:GTP cyclohydrolase I